MQRSLAEGEGEDITSIARRRGDPDFLDCFVEFILSEVEGLAMKNLKGGVTPYLLNLHFIWLAKNPSIKNIPIKTLFQSLAAKRGGHYIESKVI